MTSIGGNGQMGLGETLVRIAINNGNEKNKTTEPVIVSVKPINSDSDSSGVMKYKIEVEPAIPKDTVKAVEVKRGIVPTLKGALYGSTAAGLAGLATGLLLKENVIPFAVGSSILGGLSGAITANNVTGKWDGAFGGALVGIVPSMVSIGVSMTDFLNSNLPFLILPSAIGGLAGTFAAEEKK